MDSLVLVLEISTSVDSVNTVGDIPLYSAIAWISTLLCGANISSCPAELEALIELETPRYPKISRNLLFCN